MLGTWSRSESVSEYSWGWGWSIEGEAGSRKIISRIMMKILIAKNVQFTLKGLQGGKLSSAKQLGNNDNQSERGKC